jgi:hypothetical protein
MDDVQIQETDDGTRLVMTKQLARDPKQNLAARN